MKSLTVLLLAATSMVAVSTTAFAADLATIEDPIVVETSAADWTGFSVGVQAGIVSLNGEEDYDPEYLTPYDPYSTFDGIGGSLGVFAGYDIQVGDQFVLGIGGEVNWNNVSALEWDGDDYNVYLDWQAAVQVRAGLLVNPDTLVYALLGYSWAGFDASEYWAGTDYEGDTWTGGGVKVGAGIEAMITESMFIKGEADVTFYGTNDITYQEDPYWEITPTTASAKVGLGWKF